MSWLTPPNPTTLTQPRSPSIKRVAEWVVPVVQAEQPQPPARPTPTSPRPAGSSPPAPVAIDPVQPHPDYRGRDPFGPHIVTRP